MILPKISLDIAVRKSGISDIYSKNIYNIYSLVSIFYIYITHRKSQVSSFFMSHFHLDFPSQPVRLRGAETPKTTAPPFLERKNGWGESPWQFQDVISIVINVIVITNHRYTWLISYSYIVI